MAGELRTNVDRGGRLEVSTAIFDRQFVSGARPAVVVEGAFAQNEMIVVEVESRRVVEEGLAHLAVKGVVVEVDLEIKLLERSVHGFPEFEKPVLAGKAIRLQENLVFTVMDHIVRQMLGLRMLANMLVHSSVPGAEAGISAILTGWVTRFAS